MIQLNLDANEAVQSLPRNIDLTNNNIMQKSA